MMKKVEICGVDTSGLPKLTAKENEELMRRIKNGDKKAPAGSVGAVLFYCFRIGIKSPSPNGLSKNIALFFGSFSVLYILASGNIRSISSK